MPTDQNNTIDYLAVYTHGVDDKRRVQIPSKWRPSAEEQEFKLRLLLWQPAGQKKPCLLALPPEQWRRLRDRISGMPLSDPKAQALRRWVATNADVVTLDNAGRICLPQTLAEATGIDKQVVLQGMEDHFQIWAVEAFAEEAKPEPSAEDIQAAGI
jgi:MraZ protein